MVKRAFLIGFMGSGKTTIGRHLAKDLKWQFLDLDAYIEKEEGRTIREIFAQEGEAAFRRIETEALAKVAQMESVVIAAGGGTPCNERNIEIMRHSGATVYIKVAPEELAKRLYSARENRPLIAQKTDDELLDYIKAKLSEREPFYSRAHMIVDGAALPFSTYATLVTYFPEEELSE